MPAYSTDKGFTGSGSAYGGKDKSKPGGGNATAGVNKVTSSTYTQPRDPAGPDGNISGGSGQGPGGKAYSNTENRGGGTTTTDKYSPGATEVYGNADALTVAEKIAAPLAPGGGLVLGGGSLLKGAIEGDTFGVNTLLGGKPGVRTGFQPDRFKGKANLGGIGDPGSATSGSAGELAGRPGGASQGWSDDPSLSGRPGGGDSEDGEAIGAGTAALYSDVMLKDRRKALAGLPAGTAMLLGGM